MSLTRSYGEFLFILLCALCAKLPLPLRLNNIRLNAEVNEFSAEFLFVLLCALCAKLPFTLRLKQLYELLFPQSNLWFFVLFPSTPPNNKTGYG